MELKHAVSRAERYVEGDSVRFEELTPLISALLPAARAELARREGEKPDVLSQLGYVIDIHEREHERAKCWCAPQGLGGSCAKALTIKWLKALRETVIPWLRQLQCDTNARAGISRNQAIAYGGGQFGAIGDMLVALGEDAP